LARGCSGGFGAETARNQARLPHQNRDDRSFHIELRGRIDPNFRFTFPHPNRLFCTVNHIDSGAERGLSA
jgi:hypothetical protein